MKLSIVRAHLVNALRTAAMAASTKNTLPVLSFFRLEATDGLLSVSATNLEIGITANAPALVTDQGAICAPVKMLLDLVSAANSERVELEVDKYRLRVKWDKSKVHLTTLPAEEFPPMPAFLYEGQEIAGQAFATAIKHVAFAASEEEARPTLCGVNFQAGKLAATDGFRLSVTQLEGFDFRGLIPAKALALVARLAKDGAITMREEYGKIIFAGAGWQITSQQIDGNYPDYMVIVPKQTLTQASMDAGMLKAAANQVSAIGGPMTTLHVEANKVTVTGHNEEGAEVQSEIDTDTNGPEVQITFNTEYLAQAVSMMGKTVRLQCNKSNEPAIFRGDDPDFWHVIMPMWNKA